MSKTFLKNDKIRMHDTDAAGHLYFANLFRLAHDAYEDFMESLGYPIRKILSGEEGNFHFVIVHCEADFKAPLKIGDRIELLLTVDDVKESSFSIHYRILKEKALAGIAKSVHCTIDAQSKEKRAIPNALRTLFYDYYSSERE